MDLLDEHKIISMTNETARQFHKVYEISEKLRKNFGVGDIIIFRSKDKMLKHGNFILKMVVVAVDKAGLMWARKINIDGKPSKYATCLSTHFNIDGIELDPEYIESQLLQSKYEHNKTNELIKESRKLVKKENEKKLIQMTSRSTIKQFINECANGKRTVVYAHHSLTPNNSDHIVKLEVKQTFLGVESDKDDCVVLKVTVGESLGYSINQEIIIKQVDYLYSNGDRLKGEVYLFDSMPTTTDD